MKNLSIPLFIGAGLSANLLFAAEEHHLEEIVVTGALKKTEAQTTLPVNVIDNEKLREAVAKTLGETLNSQVGVTFASFGSGVGLPVIRGQSGNRVRVLQNNTGSLDAASVSPDHNNSIEAMLAERIEVVRGPATLLYGNGAIGGVVNVIDNRIPESLPEKLEGAIEQRHNTVNDENATVFKLDGSIGDLALHIDGFYRDSNNVEIDGFAIREDEEEHEEDDHDDEEHEEEENTHGFVANSNARAKGLTGGASWIGEDGFFGFSVSRLENNYGLPPGGHGHHEEEEDHDDDDHDEEEEGNIRLDMEQTRFDLKGARDFGGFIENVKANLTYNDYQHKEIEGSGEVGTVFENEGYEARVVFDHQAIGNLKGVIGLQLIDREFSATGEEAFIPTSDIQSAAIFVVENIEADKWTYEFGARLESLDIDADSGCDVSETTFSASTAAIYNFREDANLLVSLSRSERSATEEELFSNRSAAGCGLADELIEHAATSRAEIGNPNLDTETSTNIEIALRKHLGNITGEINFYYNEISDYIFLLDTGMETDEEAEIAEYRQQDATFKGFEAELNVPLWQQDEQRLGLTLFSDYVRADFDNGGDVPRIPPMRYGAELSYSANDWRLKVRITDVDDQDDVADNESETDGYTLLSFYADYHLHLWQQDLTLFLKGNNLLDEEIRNHTSLLKNVAPEAGKGFELGLRLTF